jgi:DNA-binding NarL/FixJ family response regulator
VLVVDDHEVVRRGLLAVLDSEPDIDVVGEAGGGAQALDLLASMESEGRRPDVIVMDLQMAPIDGIESTRRVRALYNDIEVVALTSFAEEARVHAALQAGASGYVLKDSDADDVAAAVRAAHRGELQIDPVVARRLMSSLREGEAVTRSLSSHPASWTCSVSWRRASPTSRSPTSSPSASARPGHTYPGSCGSSI